MKKGKEKELDTWIKAIGIITGIAILIEKILDIIIKLLGLMGG